MLAEYLAQSRKVVAIKCGKEIGTFHAQQIKLGETTAAPQRSAGADPCRAREIQALAAADQPDNARGRNIAAPQLHMRAGSHIWVAQRIFDLAGARAIYAKSKIRRIFLEIIVATRHVTQS